MPLVAREDAAGPYVSAHVADLDSARALVAWRRAARRDMRTTRGLVFAKALGQIGGSATRGFGAGVPSPRRLLLLCAWTEYDACAEFRAAPLGRALDSGPAAWHVLGRVTRTRGSHHGIRPLREDADPDPSGPVGVLTLGRATPRTLARFPWHGNRLAPHILGAPGAEAAISVPLTGNATVSLWRSTDDMLAFAYGHQEHGHLHAVRSRPPILVEQLNARFRPLSVEGRLP